MPYTTNHLAFLSTAKNSTDPLIRAYCGLVAVELVLKTQVGLKDHNVPAALNKFKNLCAVGAKSMHAVGLNNLRMKLTNDLIAIFCTNKHGVAAAVPADAFPNVRYTRFTVDAWGTPDTEPARLATLAATVDQLRQFLKTNFGLPL